MPCHLCPLSSQDLTEMAPHQLERSGPSCHVAGSDRKEVSSLLGDLGARLGRSRDANLSCCCYSRCYCNSRRLVDGSKSARAPALYNAPYRPRKWKNMRGCVHTIGLTEDLILDDCEHLAAAQSRPRYWTIGTKEGNTLIVCACKRAFVHTCDVRWRAKIAE